MTGFKIKSNHIIVYFPEKKEKNHLRKYCDIYQVIF